MKSATDIIDLMPISRERLSPKQFLKLVNENPSLIKSSRAVPPKPGSANFGSFEVAYSRPVYKAKTRSGSK